MTEDLLPAMLRRIEGAVRDARGMVILDVSIVIMDGAPCFWAVNQTQYEPHNASRQDARKALLDQLIETRKGRSDG